MNATTADHLILRGHTHFRKMHDHHLIQLGGEVLLKCVVFLATCSNIERLWCPVGSAVVLASCDCDCDYSTIADSEQAWIDSEALYKVERFADYRDEDIAVPSQQTYLDRG